MTAFAATLTSPFTVSLPTLSAVRLFAPELEFVPIDRVLANVGDRPGPYVYIHVVTGDAIVYIGKAEAKTRPIGRPRAYAGWVAEYEVDKEGETRDPMFDLTRGELDLLDYSPIVRFASLIKPTVHVASVVGSVANAKAWEGRLQALAGALTANESLIGGSAWEANGWTHRGRGYRWVKDRILELRAEGAL